ncbi:hypothetical protein QG37_02985 [Candidozyma auris]|uniref:Uncharacterized protein n=1 Tax=Candidozyma auris TaxID=498019 RepID=A0A0L0P197_CANAR|nr:hypothetical protein QG37_02985 [[Candida] auris]
MATMIFKMSPQTMIKLMYYTSWRNVEEGLSFYTCGIRSNLGQPYSLMREKVQPAARCNKEHRNNEQRNVGENVTKEKRMLA